MRTLTPLLIGILLLLSSCKDRTDPTGPTPPATPAALSLSLPPSVVQGQPFTLTVRVVDAAGQPDHSWGGPVTLNASAGSLSPATVTLVGGTASVQGTLSGHTGEVLITARNGAVEANASALVLSGAPAARLEIAPGALLLTRAGETRQLVVRAFDAQGQPTTAPEVVWQSSNPTNLTVSTDGTVTAVRGLGSAQITAQHGAMRSAPVLALAAQPAEGAVLVSDAQVVSDVTPVDPNAVYTLGWRYRVRLRGVSPSVGQLVIASGAAPVAGRTVAVSQVGQEVEVTLELVSLDELFRSLLIDESISLRGVPLVVSERTSLFYSVQAQPTGGMRFLSRSGALSTSWSGITPSFGSRAEEFMLGPLRCEATTAVPIAAFPLLVGPHSFELFPDFEFRVRYTPEDDFESVYLIGTLTARFSSNPLLTAAVEGKVECKHEIGSIPVPIGGVLARFIGWYVPLGWGFELAGALNVGNVGYDLFTQAHISTRMGFDRSVADRTVVEISSGTDGSYAKPVLPSPGSDFRAVLGATAFGFAELAFGPRVVSNLRFKAFEAKAGLKQEFNLTSRDLQVADAAYASTFRLAGVMEVGTGSSLNALAGLLRISLAELKFATDTTVARSPRGTFSIEPATVRAGNGQEPGELATFRVTLDPTMYWVSDAVDGVEFLWKKRNGSGGFTLQPAGGFACQPRVGGTFTCTRFFTEEYEGEQTFYAFVKAKIFGVPVPIPLEVAADGKATVTVTKDSIQVTVNPPAIALETNESQQFTATVSGTNNTEVAWRARWGRIDSRGGYVAPNFATADTVYATSVADPSAVGRALVVVTISQCPGDCGHPSDPVDTDPDGDGSGSSWGDPHLITLDGRHYDFHAVGDFILAKSTTAGDRFEVQARYRRPNVSEAYSWNNAVAMNVLGDVVNVYGVVRGIPDIVINGQEIHEHDGLNLTLPNGGAVAISGATITVSWPDRTMVEVIPAPWEPEVLGWVKVFLPRERRGAVEGLLGNFDGDQWNDLRIRGGAVLTNPTPGELYLDFRRSWNVPVSSASNLFSRKSENFDPNFPPNIVTVNNLPPAAAALAREVCRSAGILHPAVLDACILDVVLTGDERWAQIAAGVDPRIPSVTVLPRHSSLHTGESRQFGALVTGTTNRRVIWTASGGSIREDTQNLITYTPPSVAGIHTLTATLAENGSVSSSATVKVTCVAEERTFGEGATLSGDLPSVKITGAVTVIGPTSICGDLTIDGSAASLRLNGQTVQVGGDATVRAGMLRMTHDADRLIVQGSVFFEPHDRGGFVAEMTAGLLEVRGAELRGIYARFLASGTHRLLFRGTARQELVVGCWYSGCAVDPQSQLHHLEIDNPTGLRISGGAARLTGTARLSRGDVRSDGQFLFLRGDLIEVGGRWRAETTVLEASETQIPRTLETNLFVRASRTLDAELHVTRNLVVEGTGVALTLNGQKVEVGGDLTVRGGGRLRMVSDADWLLAQGRVQLFHQAGRGEIVAELTAGLLEVRGAELRNNDTGFRASGTHRLRFAGSAPQLLTFGCWYSGCGVDPAGSQLHHLEIDNLAGLQIQGGAARATGRITLSQGVLDVANRIYGEDQLVVPTGSSQTVRGQHLTVAGLDVDGLILDGIEFLSKAGTLTRFANVTFTNYAANRTQLTLEHPGASVTFNAVTFVPLGAADTGLYVRLTDTANDGTPLVVSITGTNVTNGPAKSVVTGGAQVIWP